MLGGLRAEQGGAAAEYSLVLEIQRHPALAVDYAAWQARVGALLREHALALHSDDGRTRTPRSSRRRCAASSSSCSRAPGGRCRAPPYAASSRVSSNPSEAARARLRGVGNVTHRGGCHCGLVRFEVEAPADLELSECNCSICRRSGYLHLIVPRSRFRLLAGRER